MIAFVWHLRQPAKIAADQRSLETMGTPRLLESPSLPHHPCEAELWALTFWLRNSGLKNICDLYVPMVTTFLNERSKTFFFKFLLWAYIRYSIRGPWNTLAGMLALRNLEEKDPELATALDNKQALLWCLFNEKGAFPLYLQTHS